MAGFSISILMSIIMFMYLFFIAIFVAIILYLIISYTFEGISIMCMGKKLKYKIYLLLGFHFTINMC